jgi:hypothetical protein
LPKLLQVQNVLSLLGDRWRGLLIEKAKLCQQVCPSCEPGLLEAIFPWLLLPLNLLLYFAEKRTATASRIGCATIDMCNRALRLLLVGHHRTQNALKVCTHMPLLTLNTPPSAAGESFRGGEQVTASAARDGAAG